jgi:amino acid adenylation domain-containing protein
MLNISGWNDSYTGKLIPTDDIREWVDSTVARILAYHPKRVLEMGCGTGLLLFRLAPHCHWYCGADISSEALRYIDRQLKQMTETDTMPPIPLYHQPAHDFTHLQGESIDTVIINSVIGHFPNSEYLVTVLEKAVDQLSPGGIIFIGDVFSFSLREVLHAAVQLYKAPPALSKTHLYQRIQQHWAQEDKLVIDPYFFIALQQHLPRISQVSIQLKGGARHNEMTRFRYDVTLHVEKELELPKIAVELDWQKEKLSLAFVQQFLVKEQPNSLAIKYIPNVRIRTELKLLDLLSDEEGPDTVAEIRKILSSLPPTDDPDPKDFWKLAEDLPYEVYLTPSFTHQAYYHAIFLRLDESNGKRPQIVPFVEKTENLKHWSAYANNPQQWKLAKELAPQLRAFLKNTLPDHMIPAAFVVLSHLPLTPNGKVDRRALSHTHFQRYLETTFVAPRTPAEEKLANIWASILGVEQVGIHDNFFELGGHSLQATQMISRIRDNFACELPLHDLFASPTIAQLSEHLEKASSDKQLPPITPIARNQPLPLSFAQQRLWFLDQLEGEEAIAYNESWALLLEGSLNKTALEQSLQEIVQRHEVLRTTFSMVEGKPMPIIHPFSKSGFNLTVIELQNWPFEEQQREEQRQFRTEAQRPFDLFKGPLFRATLISRAANKHILLLNLHHIIFDGWSQTLFIEELSTCYEAFSQHQQPSLPPLGIQYVDFASWQRQWLSGENLEKQLGYWKQQLANSPALLQLPTDFQRPAIQRFQGASCPIHITAELTEQLQSLSNQTGATLFMTLLSGFAILLARYSGQNDIVIGSPIANRTHSQTESMIGFFVNTLVLRLDLSDNPSFETVLQQARRVALEAYNHQDIPFEQLVEEVKPERNLSHSPLFQVLLQLQDAPVSNWEFSGLTLTQLELESVNAKFDLSLILEKTAQGLEGKLEYNTDLFKASTIERITEHFNKLLDGVVKTERKSIYELPLLTEAEQQQLIAWNDTATDYPADKTIVDLFEQQVEKTPDNIALVFENQQLSYGQLNTKANQLAHHLLSLKTQTGTLLLANNPLIAIAVERSLEMIIGLLGILKAGGAYVPIDPSYPTIRIRYMLDDSAAPLLLTQSHLKAQFSLDDLEHDCVVVCLDDMDFAEQCMENPLVKRQSADLAYVIYTSGSTGKPKGCLVTHHNVTRLFHATDHWYHFNNQDVWTLFHSYAFDFSVWELWGALLYGGKLVLVPYWMSRSTNDFHALLVEQQVTVLNQTPSAFGQLIKANQFSNNTLALRYVILGGEALEPAILSPWFTKHGDQQPQLINMYGITETTIHVTYHSLSYNNVRSSGNVIGHPIPDLQVYVLDAQQQIVPIGIPGELCIAGRGLARGYLNRPELTAKKFIEIELFGKTKRIYKTGDLARWLEDGNLEYLGRIDNQVKLRGFRIELGEIEAVLATHPAVQENVVIVHETESGDKRLVAFVVPSQGQVIDNKALRTFLTERLPDYMIPSTFVTKASLPLTPNGKIDRQALSQLEGFSYQLSEATFIAPRDTLELQLVPIWEEVLDVRQIGVRDNFFELGGHSLLAVRLMAQIEQQLNKPMPLATLFQGATIEQLATRLRQPTDTEDWSPLVAIQPKGDKTPLFCIHPSGGHVLCYFELAQHLGTEQPFYGLQAFGMEAGQQPKTTVEEMATDYLKALQTLQKQGPYQLVGWSFGGVVAFEMARQLQAQGQSVSFLGLLDTVTPAWFTDNPQESEVQETQLLVDLFAETNLALSVEHLQLLNSDEQLNYVIAQGQQANLFSSEVKPANIKRLLDVYQANRQAFQRYQPPVYEGKLTVFPATDRQDKLSPESSLGWEKFTIKVVENYPVPGNHYNMVRSPNVQVLAEQLKRGFELVPNHTTHS